MSQDTKEGPRRQPIYGVPRYEPAHRKRGVLMKKIEAINSMEVVLPGTSDERRFVVMPAHAAGAGVHPEIEAFWPGKGDTGEPEEAPPVLGFTRHGKILAMGDLIIVTASVFLALGNTSLSPVMLLFPALFAYPTWMFMLRLYDMRPDEKAAGTVRTIVLATLLSVASLCFFLVLQAFRFPFAIIAEQALIACFALSCWRILYRLVSCSKAMKIPVLIVGAGKRGRVVYNLLRTPFSPLRVEGFLDDKIEAGSCIGSPAVVGTCLDISKAAASTGAKQVIVAMPPRRDSGSVHTITEARLKGIKVQEMTDFYEEVVGRIPIRFIDDNWLVSAKGFSLLHNRGLLYWKRLMDILLSLALGLPLLPVFLIVALLIKLESPGPVFYRQARVGKQGKVFVILKFRSMRQDSEPDGARWAQENDPRVTRVGRYLRKVRLDELPQIWNILKGEMSFIGPRPERPEFVSVLKEEIPHYDVRHTVKPGVTGWAQVILRYGASVNDSLDKLEADLYYIKNMSPLLDLKIIMRTIGVVLMSQGSR